MGKDYGPPPCPPPSISQARGHPAASPNYNPTNVHGSGQPIIVTTVVPVGPSETRMICPHCHAQIATITKPRPGTMAYISGSVICLLGGFLGCCLIPCCINNCMDIHHSCPNCNAYLGRYRR